MTAHEWRPIETAPKDGTHVLIWSKPWALCWHGYWQHEKPPGWPSYLEWFPHWTRTNFCDPKLLPTHWMSLPDPPKDAGP